MPEHLEIYRSQASQYDLLVAREDYQHNILPALQQIVPFKGLTVVEFGAGTGRLTCLLAPLVSFIHAFDRSQAMLDVAAANLKKSGWQNGRMAVSDHRQIPITDALADVALSGWSVCYVVTGNPETWQAELSKVLDEMLRVTRPGGALILLETLGTGCEQPDPPAKLIPYYQYLEAHGFQHTWIRTDYQFESIAEAETLARFFYGESMLEKIQPNERGALLPECTGIWWKRSLL
jgi:ubiquinone/menaquinone biosynthesis C-methylase UbiE